MPKPVCVSCHSSVAWVKVEERRRRERRPRTISVRVTADAGERLDALADGYGTVGDVVRDALGHYLDTVA